MESSKINNKFEFFTFIFRAHAINRRDLCKSKIGSKKTLREKKIIKT